MSVKFKNGDRVEATCDKCSENSYLRIGDTGTVCQIYYNSIGVEWDRMIDGHNCNGSCLRGYGWYVKDFEIRPEIEIDIEESSFLKIV